MANNTSLKNLVQHKAYKVVFWQLVGVLIIALIMLLLGGFKNGMSALLGGLAYGISNLLFVWRVFRYSGAQEMSKFMAAFFAGEMLKLVLSGILFLMIVKTLPVSLLSVLVGFAGAIVSFWVVCMWQFSKQNTLK